VVGGRHDGIRPCRAAACASNCLLVSQQPPFAARRSSVATEAAVGRRWWSFGSAVESSHRRLPKMEAFLQPDISLRDSLSA
jgi:hypothetical protein